MHVRFVVDEMALGLVFSPVSIILPMLDTDRHLHVSLSISTSGRRLGTSQKATLVRKSENVGCDSIVLS